LDWVETARSSLTVGTALMRSPFADADIGAGRFCFDGSVSIVRSSGALGKMVRVRTKSWGRSSS
jgi:hypothetical protein